MNNPHSLLIVDDDPLVRDAYQALLGTCEAYSICAEARTGAEACQLYDQHQPDVVLMDMQMPIMDGVEAIRTICSRWRDARIIALTTFGTREYIVAALRAGACGYLLKDAGAAGILEGLRQALAGEMPLSPQVRQELVGAVIATHSTPSGYRAEITSRECTALHLLARGMTNSQIGAAMYLSEGAIKQVLSVIGTKLGAKSRTQILIKSIQHGIVDPRNLEA